MTVGDKIPEVLGIDQDGREIKSSDYRGRKIVLYSYPKANTSGCTAEACSLQAHKGELAAAGYDIIGVSKDKQALQKKFADTNGLEFPLIADTHTSLLQALGCGERKWRADVALLALCEQLIWSMSRELSKRFSLRKKLRPKFMQNKSSIISTSSVVVECYFADKAAK